MRILYKSTLAVTVAALCLASCAARVPWRDEPIRNEVNLAFTLERNLVELSTLTIDGRAGRFILGSAAPRTMIDPSFIAGASRHVIQMGERETLRISPSPFDLGGVADAIIGADAWRQHAITIDYTSGLVTYQKEGIKPGLMSLYQFDAEPMINLTVDGQQMSAIVDTSIPDTLVLPGAKHQRGKARVVIAGSDFGNVDVQYANVASPRIGNRLLSHFLVTIDYGRRVVGLWRDPRSA